MSERTTAELEQDAENARARIADTAETIRARMTPGQLIDEFAGFFAGGDGKSVMSNLKTQALDNPLPLALVGTGLAWLILGQGASSSRSSNARPNTSEWQSSNTAPDVAPGQVDSALHSVHDFVSDVASSTAERARDTWNSAQDNLQRGKDWTDQTAHQATDAVTDIADRARRKASEVLEGEPLVIAAVGLALGTAIGAVLPRSSLEDANLGAYANKLRESATGLMEKGVQSAKEVAAETYQAVKDEADRQGMTAADGSSLVDKVSQVMRSASSRAEEVVRDKFPAADEPGTPNAG